MKLEPELEEGSHVSKTNAAIRLLRKLGQRFVATADTQTNTTHSHRHTTYENEFTSASTFS